MPYATYNHYNTLAPPYSYCHTLNVPVTSLPHSEQQRRANRSNQSHGTRGREHASTSGLASAVVVGTSTGIATVVAASLAVVAASYGLGAARNDGRRLGGKSLVVLERAGRVVGTDVRMLITATTPRITS